MSPGGTEFACDFCAGIDPLQLGVVLVFIASLNSRYRSEQIVFMKGHFWNLKEATYAQHNKAYPRAWSRRAYLNGANLDISDTFPAIS